MVVLAPVHQLRQVRAGEDDRIGRPSQGIGAAAAGLMPTSAAMPSTASEQVSASSPLQCMPQWTTELTGPSITAP